MCGILRVIPGIQLFTILSTRLLPTDPNQPLNTMAVSFTIGGPTCWYRCTDRTGCTVGRAVSAYYSRLPQPVPFFLSQLTVYADGQAAPLRFRDGVQDGMCVRVVHPKEGPFLPCFSGNYPAVVFSCTAFSPAFY